MLAFAGVIRVGAVVLVLLGACTPSGARTEEPPAQTTPPAPSPGKVDERPPPCPWAPLAARGTVVFVPDGASEARVVVEVASTDGARQKGMMCRTSMTEQDGMLFLFEEEELQSFWMKNTYLPLDIIFVRHDLTVAGVSANAEPLTLTPRAVPVPSQFVVEVTAGWAARHSITAGTKVRFEGVEGF